ncbi:FxDxF family PEP-CTERM protein [Bradyrhizobium sp. 200]|uniref:FxDxF family PEP-CTERM protein n=1 Tax=Bradyrhizobium sp. 200 TaxID=2782665 RepID=UPI001FFFA877|nr:FxDxF family PEP-CTERM protein [Bradyrhizobium sp. 200]UPJ53260.1 FxDxF family PEP-CTERM protein [Bradyrhizobium sp. 200]
MKRFLLAIAATLTIIAPASAATCTSTSNIGMISTPGFGVFGNSFGSVQHFSDCFTFTLNGPGSAAGLSWELDLSWARDIDLTSVSLSGGSLPSTIVDASPGSFSFGNLIAGGYQLVITGDVTGRNGGFLGGGLAGYGGLFTTTTVQAAPVPGPIVGAGLPGLVMALGGLIAWRRRRMAAA